MTDGQNISWYSDPRKWFRAMLMLDDSSHRIALGAAIGMFIALTPTVGIQMILVLLFALLTGKLFRFNKVAALLMVYVSNPLTVVPIYWFGYKLGTIYFPDSISRSEFESLFEYNGLAEWWSTLTRLFADVGVPLIVGCLVMATCASLATYPIMLRMIRSMRRSERQAMRAKKEAKRREKEARKAAKKDQSSDASADSSVDLSTELSSENPVVGAESQRRV